jgi:hypothetical protein
MERCMLLIALVVVAVSAQDKRFNCRGPDGNFAATTSHDLSTSPQVTSGSDGLGAWVLVNQSFKFITPASPGVYCLEVCIQNARAVATTTYVMVSVQIAWGPELSMFNTSVAADSSGLNRFESQKVGVGFVGRSRTLPPTQLINIYQAPGALVSVNQACISGELYYGQWPTFQIQTLFRGDSAVATDMLFSGYNLYSVST